MNKKNTLIKSLTLIVALFGAVNLGFGQTTLSAGDIAITGFNSDNPDQFTFVLLADVTAGTIINFTDNGWLSSNVFRNGEGTITWTANSALSCGTEITITDNSPFSASEGSVTDSAQFALSTDGDQILAYQGPGATPTFLYAINFNWPGWLLTGIPNSNASYLPAGLTNSANALDLIETDNADYNCTITAGISLILSAVSDASNWNLSDSLISLGSCGFSCALCPGTPVTYNGGWSATPDLTTPVAIITSYDTSLGSFQACTITVSPGANLTVRNDTYIEVQNDVTIDGTLSVETHGNFVQNSDSSVFTNNGVSVVRKETAVLGNWVDYTYWSSPVNGLTIGSGPLVDSDRRFWYNAANYFDGDSDGLDDNADDWQVAGNATSMTPGRGFAASHSQLGWVGSVAYNYNFFGEFNNGIITPPVYYNAANPLDHWNLLGNPYPSAISADDFFTANSGVIKESVYLWSHNSLIDPGNLGNESNNYNVADYAVINIASETSGSDGITPNRFIPSGQGFFVSTEASGTVEFNNTMRTADGTSNSQFFKNSNTKNTPSSSANKLWFNLTSNNGVYNQISVAYVDGATNDNDGSSYDAKRISETYAFIYSLIDSEIDYKFIIQGKSPNSLNEDEVISLGFDTNIDVPTVYTLSIAQLQGDFLTNNPMYLKDNITGTIHNLSDSDYAFTSDVGEFKDRFEIVFNNVALSNDTFDSKLNTLQIMQVTDNQVRFSTSNNLSIKNVRIYDLLGRQLYQLEGNSNVETYNLSSLNNSVFIAKVELSNGALISKKAIKK